MRALLTASLCTLALAAPAATQAPDGEASVTAEASGSAFSPAQRDEFGSLVRAYLLENPEVLEEAYIILIERREAEEAAASAAALAEQSDAIYRDPRDFSIGPADAKVTVVEFFDYTCGWCKASVPWIRETLAAHPDDVRIVFKEMPRQAAGPIAEAAAKAALASIDQKKYLDFHFALMENKGEFSGPRIDEIAKAAGLNVKKMRARMAQPDVREHVEDNVILAETLGLDGTPAFIVNDVIVRGADFDQLDALIEAGLAGG